MNNLEKCSTITKVIISVGTNNLIRDSTAYIVKTIKEIHAISVKSIFVASILPRLYIEHKNAFKVTEVKNQLEGILGSSFNDTHAKFT